jgi:hypothetical protein
LKTPVGTAPKWVREAWTGLELPAAPGYWGVVGVAAAADDTEGYAVHAHTAFSSLERDPEKAKAYEWYLQHQSDLFQSHVYLRFGKRFCELVT